MILEGFRAVPFRVRIALALSFVALVAALVGALGPAERVRTTYSWPPPTLPEETASSVWYTPLLLVRHQPESIAARIPCSLGPALPGAARPTTVLATARYPERTEALAVSLRGNRLVIGVGRRILHRVDTVPAPARLSDCAYDLSIGSGHWSIRGGPNKFDYQGSIDEMPRVTGLFSALELRSGQRPSIDVTTAVHATHPTVRQKVAWALAALSALTALLLISVERRPRPWASARRVSRTVLSHADPVDALVGAMLLFWWVFSPAFFDDGWVLAREQMFSSSNGFSNYYSTLAGNLPLDYWLEWAHHWVVEATSALLILRVPTLVCLAATWVLCRWIVARVTSGSSDRIVLWSLLSAFVIGAMAWGMTLRPEPISALLFTAVTACLIRFLERDSAASLAVAAVLVVLAGSAHHTGVVSLAPVIVAAPRMLGWARHRMTLATTIVVSASALFVVLVFVGSDFGQRRFDAQLATTYPNPWRDEFSRYAFLNVEPWATPLRRMAVGLIMLAAVAFVLRQRRMRAGLLDFPAQVLVVAAVLFVATPTKWAWHFGALIGVGAVAVASETARLRAEAARSRGWSAWPFIAVAAAAGVGAWAWWTQAPWNPVDLRTLEWDPGFDRYRSQGAALLPVLLLAVTALIALSRRERSAFYAFPARAASWTPLALAVPPILFTAGILIVDSAGTSSWTLARQNIQTIVGNPDCGLARDLLVRIESSTFPVSMAAKRRGTTPSAPWVPPAPIRNLDRFDLGPASEGQAQSPWFALPADRRVGLFVAGDLAPSDTLWLDWGRQRRGGTDPLGSDEFTNVLRTLSGDAPWRFLARSDLPAPEHRATAVRITFRTRTPGSAVAVTAPVVYTNEPLARRMDSVESRTLVYPELLTYFPCTRLPTLRDGAVEVPQHIVFTERSFPLGRDAYSPFLGLLDLYELERLPVSDTEHPPEEVIVFALDRWVPGASIAPPDKRTLSS